MKFEEAIQEQIELEHKCAVVDKLVEYLNEYLPSDFGDSKVMIDKMCINPTIGVDAICAVLTDLEAFKGFYSNRIDELRSSTVK